MSRLFNQRIRVSSGGGGGTTDAVARSTSAANAASITALNASQAAQDALIAAAPTQAQVDTLQATQDAEDPYKTFTRQTDGSIDWERESGATGAIAAPAATQDTVHFVPPARADATRGVEPTTAETRAALVDGDTAAILLPDGTVEEWEFTGGAWVLRQTRAFSLEWSGPNLPNPVDAASPAGWTIPVGNPAAGLYWKHELADGSFLYVLIVDLASDTPTPATVRIMLASSGNTQPSINYSGANTDVWWRLYNADDSLAAEFNDVIPDALQAITAAGMYWELTVADVSKVIDVSWSGIRGIGTLPDLTVFPNLAVANLSANNFATPHPALPVSVEELTFTNAREATPDWSYLVNLRRINLRVTAGTRATALTLPTGRPYELITVAGMNLDAVSVDAIFNLANAGGFNGGSIDIAPSNSGTNAQPTGGQANADYVALIAKGWTIIGVTA